MSPPFLYMIPPILYTVSNTAHSDSLLIYLRLNNWLFPHYSLWCYIHSGIGVCCWHYSRLLFFWCDVKMYSHNMIWMWYVFCLYKQGAMPNAQIHSVSEISCENDIFTSTYMNMYSYHVILYDKIMNYVIVWTQKVSHWTWHLYVTHYIIACSTEYKYVGSIATCNWRDMLAWQKSKQCNIVYVTLAYTPLWANICFVVLCW